MGKELAVLSLHSLFSIFGFLFTSSSLFPVYQFEAADSLTQMNACGPEGAPHQGTHASAQPAIRTHSVPSDGAGPPMNKYCKM